MIHRRVRRSGLVAAALVLGAGMFVPDRAPATVSEQRERLPPPADCEDPVTGQWKAHVYYGHVREWYIFTLDIRRVDAGAELTGEIHVLVWPAQPNAPEPPPCRDGRGPKRVLQTAKGNYGDGRLAFEGTSWRFDGADCDRTGAYAFDRFSGKVNLERQEFQAVLNADIPGWKDVPTVFRRIGCNDPPPVKKLTVQPKPPAKPPPYTPKRSKGGCGC